MLCVNKIIQYILKDIPNDLVVKNKKIVQISINS